MKANKHMCPFGMHFYANLLFIFPTICKSHEIPYLFYLTLILLSFIYSILSIQVDKLFINVYIIKQLLTCNQVVGIRA